MRCPVCQHADTRVVDSRESGDGIRRRRSCLQCNPRFSTVERPEVRLPWVVKKDGRREVFERDKIAKGMALACRKRPIGPEEIDAAVGRVEAALVDIREPEIPSERIGEIVMEVLRGLDAVAYERYASVYRAFESVEQFGAALRESR